MRWLFLSLLSLVALRCAHAPEAAPAAAPAPQAVAAAPSWPEPQPPALRLPDTVRPVHYGLDLTLLPAQPTYSGTVHIDVEVREPVRQVWLHAQDVQVSQARVSTRGRTLEARVVTADTGRLGLLLPEPLEAGPAQLTLTFTGQVDRERSRGLYSVEEKGEPYLYTFFEPVDARRAFPCFDEPGFKVPWRLRFTVKREHGAYANSPVESEEPLPEGLKRVTFADSKPMPSYLVAFMVGPFDAVEAGSIGRAHVPLQFIVPRGRGPETAYAARVTPRIITLLEDFFDQTYPYEKLDVAVVPRYWGTMEHPGIVALGQPLTLMTPEQETPSRRLSYANIAIHELGHYWFGDVVTCRWWDDIWLNESLTTWLDERITEQFEPAWNFAQDSHAHWATVAFSTDSHLATPPVRKPIATQADIIGSFDGGTTYSKGSLLIRMLEGWLGERPVRDLLRAHVREHAWGVASTEDFLATVRTHLGPDAALVMKDELEQAGVPRVSAQMQCQPGKPPRLRLSQERFLPEGSQGATAQVWHLPVCVRVPGPASASRQCTLLTAATGELELPGQTCPTWVLLNAGGSGYYRVAYSPEQRSRLSALGPESLSVPERLALLSDLRASVEHGDALLGELLPLVPPTARDSQRLIVQGGSQLLAPISPERLPDAERELYRAWLRELYGPRARALGWLPRPGESDDVKQLRSLVLRRAAEGGEDPALKKEASRLARAWLADRKAVSEEVADLALGVAARDGDGALFDTVLAQAHTTQNPEERSSLLFALGRFRDPALVGRALSLVVGTEFDVRDSSDILYATLATPTSRDRAWAFYREHFDEFIHRMRSDDLNQLVALVGVFCDEPHRAEVEAFMRPRIAQVEGGTRSLDRALESIRLCAVSERRQQPSVLQFLRSRHPR